MSVHTDRFDAAIDRLGEVVTWTKLGGSVGSFARNGIVRQAEAGVLSQYFDSVELGAIVRPALAVVCKSGTAVAVNDTFTRDSVNYICVKVGVQRLGNEVVTRMALMKVA
ncbi:MAG: hypothetical protein B7Z62_00205 [Deltaproteobacteria bacterium 37-65-8]|nr:MAG: hypothetical protein B7Z62_00205 [Deltaproteobacteria bacterium 37-65-8]